MLTSCNVHSHTLKTESCWKPKHTHIWGKHLELSTHRLTPPLDPSLSLCVRNFHSYCQPTRRSRQRCCAAATLEKKHFFFLRFLSRLVLLFYLIRCKNMQEENFIEGKAHRTQQIIWKMSREPKCRKPRGDWQIGDEENYQVKFMHATAGKATTTATAHPFVENLFGSYIVSVRRVPARRQARWLTL